MNILNEIIDTLIMLIPIGSGLRLVICFLKIKCNPDEKEIYKKRIKNTLKFTVLAACVVEISNLIISYYR